MVGTLKKLHLEKLHLGKITLLAGVLILGGSAVAAGASPAYHGGGRHRTGPVVTSVNGVSTAGTCGTSGGTGSFTVVGMRLHIVTVDVTSTTTFVDTADPTPSFGDVCVGNHVKVVGTYASDAETATTVTVLPPNLARTEGVVTAVNGVSPAGTCGVAGDPGSFTYVGRHLRIVTVDVTSTTKFTDAADATPSFADVCVGDDVIALGTLSSTDTLAATSVTVVPANTGKATGIVASVNGSSASGSCGVAGDAGSFTLGSRRVSSIVTVDVTTETTFTDASDPTPSFADVCVGNRVSAIGTVLSTTLTATSVAVVPPNTGRDQGTVTSVNGVSTAGTCGVAGDPGAFTLVGNWRRGIVTVEVTSTTTFIDPTAATTPSFADICVGVHAGALGSFSSTGTLTATSVAVLPSGHVPLPEPIVVGHGRG